MKEDGIGQPGHLGCARIGPKEQQGLVKPDQILRAGEMPLRRRRQQPFQCPGLRGAEAPLPLVQTVQQRANHRS